MATGRFSGPLEGPLSLAGRVINDPWPLGLNPQPAALKAKPGGPPKPQPPSEPAFQSGKFKIDISGPTGLNGPSYDHQGAYYIDPDATMHLRFVGVVSLPPGTWDVGIVQNLTWCNHIESYSEGGQIAFAFAAEAKGPLLDVLKGASDIFLDSLGNAVVTLVSPTPDGQFRHKVSLDAGDTPRKANGYDAERTRCQGKITEQLDDIEESNVFSAALIARKEGVIHQLVVTGDKYGYRYRFEVPYRGGPPDWGWLDFHAFLSTKLLRPVDWDRFKQALLTTDLKGPTANDVTNKLAKEAEDRYKRDCSVKPPRPQWP
jgi:hypothetical protein